MVKLPSATPKQLALLTVPFTADTFSTAGPEIVTQAVCAQRFMSVTVTQYCPAASPVASAVDCPLLHTKLYGAVPPFAVARAEPSALFEQLMALPLLLDTTVAVTDTGELWERFVQMLLRQPFWSVTVTQ